MKRKLALILVVSLILSLGAFSTVSFAAEEIEIIETGAEFVEKVVSGKPNTTFKIEGTETLDDGSIGIRLTTDEEGTPINHTSISNFSGNVIGVEGKNNIQINKPLFGSFTSKAMIKNINLKTDENGAFAAGTAEGYGALVSIIKNAGTYTVEEVSNYCNISSSQRYLGGLIGQVTDGTLTLNLCSNYGSVTGDANYVGGLIGGLSGNTKVTFTINKSFNAGKISGPRNTAGIAGYVNVASGTISNSFNAGNVITSATNAANGGAGIAVPTTACLIVNNVYNVGALSHSGGYSDRVSNIVQNAGVSSSSNCYYIANANATRAAVGEEKTIEKLAAELPEGFVQTPAVWEYVETSETNKYSLPQIIGNTFVTTSTAWYVEPKEEEITVGPASDDILFAKGEDTEFDAQLAEDGITGGYAIVASKFTVPSGEFKFGMLLSEEDLGEDLTFENENYSADAKGKNHCKGAFGILFYGNKLKNGNTYYVRPYVEINGVYTYGAPTSFVFSAE